MGFFNFCVLSLNFENSLFEGLLKHYKNRGFSKLLCLLLLLKEKKTGKKTLITGISGFWFFGPKWPFRDAYVVFKKSVETPIFIVFWGCALFGPSCQKGNFGHPPPKRKVLLITEKLIFEYFLVFQFFFLCFFFFVLFLFFLFYVVFLEGLRVR